MSNAGRWTSSGRKLLVSALASMTAVEIGRRVGVTPQAISLLAGGLTREPSLRLGLRLQELFGIDAHAWLDSRLSLVATNVSPLSPSRRTFEATTPRTAATK